MGKKFQCDICHKLFGRKDRLKFHIKNSHVKPGLHISLENRERDDLKKKDDGSA